jgi:hypothetical protein
MPITSRYKELFRKSTTQDKLTLFQALLNAKEDMTTDLALALLKIIHKELSTHQTRDRSAYKLYASTIEALRYHKENVLRQVVAAWSTPQSTTPEEWFSNYKNR